MRGQVFAMSVPAPRRQAWAGFPCSVVLHSLIVAGLLCVPLLSDGDLPEPFRNVGGVFFVQPVTLPPAPPPAARQGRERGSRPPARPSQDQGLVAPPEIPDMIELDDPGDLFLSGIGDPNGVVGGTIDGVVSGIVGGLTTATPEPETTPIPVGGNVHPPSKMRDVPPHYPELARRIGLQGDVVLECVISRDGRVSEIRVVSGHVLLQEAATAAAAQWIYSPTLLNGIPVPVLLRATIQFRL